MIQYVFETGTHGLVRIQDRTDEPDVMYVDISMLSNMYHMHSPERQIPWTYSLDDEMQDWQSHTGPVSGRWDRLGIIHVPLTTVEFSFHLGPTGTAELGGPHQFTFTLAMHGAGGPTVDIKHNGHWMKAVPFVKHAGEWKMAAPFMKANGAWSPVA